MAWSFTLAQQRRDAEAAARDAEELGGFEEHEAHGRALRWLDEPEAAAAAFRAAAADALTLDRREVWAFGAAAGCALRLAGDRQAARPLLLEAAEQARRRPVTVEEEPGQEAAMLRLLAGEPADLRFRRTAPYAGTDLGALRAERERLVAEVREDRALPGDAGAPFNRFDWLELAVEVEARATGAERPPLGAVLEQAGLRRG